jgi:ADP-dependent NAD(P)H-hydrate dehydratase
VTDVSSDPLPRLAPRRADSHKGDYGRVLVLGGSRGMAGAPSLTAVAALRSGAGLVTVATPDSVQPMVAALNPCYTTIPLIEDEFGIADMANVMDLAAAREQFDVWAVGPGLGQTDGVAEMVAQLYRDIPRPMVVDADGLNALASSLRRNPNLLSNPAGPRILTPHPGEFKRLSGEAAGESLSQRAEQAMQLCRRDVSGKTVVVLKGHQSIVADGVRFAANSTGNPGMATGGTGDCLTGVIAALVAQGLDAWSAARLGAHVHGLAGDLAANELSEISLIASDLLDYLPMAFKSL